MIKVIRAAALAIGFIGAAAAPASAGIMTNGIMSNGVILNGIMSNGIMSNGTSTEGHKVDFTPAGLILPNGTAVTLR